MDEYKRKLFLKSEYKKNFLKSFKVSQQIPYDQKYKALYYISKLPRATTKSQIRNRCFMSGRVWHVNSKTKLSRFVFRKYAYQASLPGFSRASW